MILTQEERKQYLYVSGVVKNVIQIVEAAVLPVEERNDISIST